GRSVIENRIILAVKFGGGTVYSRGGTTAWLTGAQRDDIDALGFHGVDVADDIHDLKSGDCRTTTGGKFMLCHTPSMPNHNGSRSTIRIRHRMGPYWQIWSSDPGMPVRRSEERRVGKECRSRWRQW